MNKLFVVLLIAFLVAVVYLRIGRATQQPVERAAVQSLPPPARIRPPAQVADPVAALERDIARMRAAMAADQERLQAQLQSIRDKYEKARREAEVYRQMLADREHEANAVSAERQARLADLERRLEKIRQEQPRKPGGDGALAGDIIHRFDAKPTGIEAKLDLILQRLDDVEKRLQKLEGRFERINLPLHGPQVN
jgi:chromosome segregation ATPase